MFPLCAIVLCTQNVSTSVSRLGHPSLTCSTSHLFRVEMCSCIFCTLRIEYLCCFLMPHLLQEVVTLCSVVLFVLKVFIQI